MFFSFCGCLLWAPAPYKILKEICPTPTYAHILLTTPQKQPRLASYQLWSHSEPNKARTSRTTAKIMFFHVFFSFCGYLLWAPAPHKTWRTCSKKKKKKKHGLIRLSFEWKPFCNDLEVNRARGDREIRLWKMSGWTPSFWLVPGSIPWTPKNARTR